MIEFKNGTQLKMVSGPWSEVGQDQVCHVVGAKSPYEHTDAISITVVMVAGQMSNVPWAKVIKPDGRVIMVSLLLMEEVEVLPYEKGGE